MAEYASDDYVRAQMLDLESNWYRWGGLRYLLYEYELSLMKGGRPDTQYTYFETTKREKTVEHVLPQTATSAYWKERFGKRACSCGGSSAWAAACATWSRWSRPRAAPGRRVQA